MTLEQYIGRHIDAEPPYLHALYRRTHLERLYPRMCTDHIQGRILAMLTAMIRPGRIVELGTFTGYSTLCMAETMPPGCHIDTIELDQEYSDDIRATFAEAGHADDITLHTGDAMEVLPRLLASASYDMAFIDANKRHYTDYYALLSAAMAPGSFILADNTLWDDKILDSTARDAQTEGIRRFNDAVAADPTVSKVILPIRDGLTILRKLV